MTDVCSKWSTILGANRRLGNAKSAMLQGSKPDAAWMHALASFDTYCDRHVLGLLLCAGVIVLLCAVLCCARGSDTQRPHICAYYCCCSTPVQYLNKGPRQKWGKKKAGHCCIKWSRGHVGSRQLCLLGSVVVWCARKRRHSNARHSVSKDGAAPHRTAGNDTERRRTAPCSAVKLAKQS